MLHVHRAARASVHAMPMLRAPCPCPCICICISHRSRLGDSDDVRARVRAGVGHEEEREEVGREEGGRCDGRQAIVLVEALEGVGLGLGLGLGLGFGLLLAQSPQRAPSRTIDRRGLAQPRSPRVGGVACRRLSRRGTRRR